MRISLAEADVMTLQSDRLSLAIDLNFGARVTSLTDRRSGRQWLLQGPHARDTSDTALYRGEASRGWDECFPTILPCQSSAWGGRLRDHGMLWGRPWQIVDSGALHLTARFAADGISFARTLKLYGPAVSAIYTLTSARTTPLPYLWSQHCVLRVNPADRISVSGIGRMQAAGTSFDWPAYPGRNLTRVGLQDEGFALKSYGLTPGMATASVNAPDGGLRFEWHGTEVPALGVWLSYGGWPEEGPLLHQVALEPTTGAADDLAGAEALGQARWLKPGETHSWSVRLTVTDPDTTEQP